MYTKKQHASGRSKHDCLVDQNKGGNSKRKTCPVILVTLHWKPSTVDAFQKLKPASTSKLQPNPERLRALFYL